MAEQPQATGLSYQDAIARKNLVQTPWQKHIYAAQLANNSNPQTMLGYLVGSLFRDKFHDWFDNKVLGYPKEKNPTDPPTNTTQGANDNNSLFGNRYTDENFLNTAVNYMRGRR